MKTIKIIDLLNKIANGEEVPTDIKVGIHKFYKCRKHNVYDDFDYQNEDGEYLLDYLSEYEYLTKYINNEVEILDEEDEFEDVKRLPINELYLTESQQSHIVDSINALIKNQKKIIERLKKEGKEC